MGTDCTDRDCHPLAQEQAQAPEQAQPAGKGGSAPITHPLLPNGAVLLPLKRVNTGVKHLCTNKPCAAPRIALPITGTLLEAVGVLARVTVALILAQKCKTK